MTTAPSIEARAAFDFIRYASVWEDADVLCEALAPVAQGHRLLSIASAGDNALALLTLDPAEVVAVDLNTAQLACLELRIAAYHELEDNQLLEFLGFPTPQGLAADMSAAKPREGVSGGTHEVLSGRAQTYARLRTQLSLTARAFWDAHPEAITHGIIHAGKFERYFHAFRRWILPLVHRRATIAALRAAKSGDEQERFYRDHWDTWRWRALFRLFFSRFVMGRAGRDPEFFTHVDGPVATRILARTRHALTAISTASNPYLTYILTGNFSAAALPRYMCAEHRAAIRARLDRVRVVAGTAESAPGPFRGFNLSDIFEYMSTDQHERTYRALVDRAAPGARLVYWNMLAPRSRPECLATHVQPLDELAADLHARDRAWFYQCLHVDEVTS